jgi:hypothetical protein
MTCTCTSPVQVLTEKDIKDDQPDILELFLPWTPTAGMGMQSGAPASHTQHIHVMGDASLLFNPHPHPRAPSAVHGVTRCVVCWLLPSHWTLWTSRSHTCCIDPTTITCTCASPTVNHYLHPLCAPMRRLHGAGGPAHQPVADRPDVVRSHDHRYGAARGACARCSHACVVSATQVCGASMHTARSGTNEV